MRGGYQYYTSHALDSLWGKGMAVIGELTFESAAYVAGYVLKKITGPHAKAAYKYIGVKPPYATWSNGIGRRWLEEYGEETYEHDSVVVRGRETRPPRYYDNWYAEKFGEEALEAIKEERKEKAKKHEANNTPKRRRDRAKLDAVRAKRRERELS